MLKMPPSTKAINPSEIDAARHLRHSAGAYFWLILHLVVIMGFSMMVRFS